MRIMIVGNGGAGKSTLARELGRRTGITVVHLDAIHWQPGWVEPPLPAFLTAHARALSGSEWIVDGNYGHTMAARLALADLVVFLDYSRWTCLRGVVRRRWQYRARSRPDMAPHCPERLDMEFLRYVWSYPRKHRSRVLTQVAQHGKQQALIRLRSRREARRWLDSGADQATADKQTGSPPSPSS